MPRLHVGIIARRGMRHFIGMIARTRHQRLYTEKISFSPAMRRIGSGARDGVS